MSISLDDARALAVQAVKDGKPELALQVADGLLQADRKSSFAHFVAANALGQLGDPNRARQAAAKAYRFAKNPDEKFAAAELAAKMAYAEERPTLAQLWLRRAAQNAPSGKIEEQLGRDYARVRRENPLSFGLSGGVRPSSNINNGSASDLETVNGVPTGGIFRGSAQALDGIVGDVNATLSYRLRQNNASQTVARGSLYVSRVSLSDAAAEIAAEEGLGDKDFGLTYATIGLDHSFRVGKTGSADVGLTLGQLWTGGAVYYRFAKIDVARHWSINDWGRFTLTASLENRDVRASDVRDAVVWSLGARMGHHRDNGDKISLEFKIGETRSDSFLIDAQSASLSGRYAFGEQIGPMKLSLGLSLGITELDRYTSFATTTNGRRDRSVTADIRIFFPDVDYMGFAPAVSVKAGRKFSNFSRFDTKEFSISLGIRSKF